MGAMTHHIVMGQVSLGYSRGDKVPNVDNGILYKCYAVPGEWKNCEGDEQARGNPDLPERSGEEIPTTPSTSSANCLISVLTHCFSPFVKRLLATLAFASLPTLIGEVGDLVNPPMEGIAVLIVHPADV